MKNKKNSRLPVLFVGHGNPMHAIQEDAFAQKLRQLSSEIPQPKLILCVSAHWTTEGTWITQMLNPKTIHDFYGFPKELFDVQYPAKGSPEFADLIRMEIKDPPIQADDKSWGLDHGTWSVLRHMYPKADIPVIQLSLNIHKPTDYHYKLGELLRPLREKGILIIGSGNLVHNLREANFSSDAKAFPWAIEFDEWVKEHIEKRDYDAIIKKATQSKAGKLSIPTLEHWLPLLYVLGASDLGDSLRFEYEGIENSSISMRCLSLGL